MRFLLFALLFSSNLFSQSLSPERVKRIKAATVQVIVEDGSSSGTGFFINDRGDIATCFHVIDSARIYHKRIFIRFNDGDTAEVVMADTSIALENQFVYDNCILSPKRKLIRAITYLKLGEFNNTQEGDEVYTCGYPLGASQQFISRGMISTKYYEDFYYYANKKLKVKPRQTALLDLTMNRGNSGGAIMSIEPTIENDRVIGIADFNVNPIGNTADSLIQLVKQLGVGTLYSTTTDNRTGKTIEYDINKAILALIEAIKSLSIGVSGCISVNYLRETGLLLNK